VTLVRRKKVTAAGGLVMTLFVNKRFIDDKTDDFPRKRCVSVKDGEANFLEDNKMKKLLTIGMSVAILSTSAVGFAADGKWGSAELKTAASAALDKFKATLPEADANISTVNVKRGVQGNSAKIVVSYKEADAVKTAEYFCHVHQHEGEEEAEIDCH